MKMMWAKRLNNPSSNNTLDLRRARPVAHSPHRPVTRPPERRSVPSPLNAHRRPEPRPPLVRPQPPQVPASIPLNRQLLPDAELRLRRPPPPPREEVLPLESLPEDELEGWQRKCAPPEYGPTTQLGPNLRLQARRGHRAGVIELRPGLYLVAEVPAEALQRPEFGAAFLVPLVTSVAVEALKQPATQQALQRVVQTGIQLVTPQVAGPTSWHLALPEPPKTPTIPNLPWATPDDIAGTFGCDGYAPGHCPCMWRHR